jgi:hypothetical protein
MDTRRQQTSKIGNKKHVSSSIQGGQAKTEFGPAESRVRVRDARHAAYLCFHWPVQSSTSSRPSILALTVHQFAAVGTVASASTSAKYPLRIILGRQQPTSTYLFLPATPPPSFISATPQPLCLLQHLCEHHHYHITTIQHPST